MNQPIKTIDITLTWAAAMRILIAALEHGTPEGKRLAKQELFELAGTLDSMLPDNAPDIRKLSPAPQDHRQGLALDNGCLGWVDWSRAVIDALIDDLEITNGDAQGIFESVPQTTANMYHAAYTPREAAKGIDAATRTEG